MRTLQRFLGTPVFIVSSFVIVFVMCRPMHGQDYLSAIGNPTFATTIPVDNGAIDLGNGDLNLTIPIAGTPQRGGSLSSSQAMVYDGRIWQIVATGSGPTYSWQPTNIPGAPVGWRFVNALSGIASAQGFTTPCDSYPPTNAWTLYFFAYTDPTGGSHSFDVETQRQYRSNQNNPCYDSTQPDVTSGDGLATDSSGYHLYVNNYTQAVVYDRYGDQVYPKVEDANGNYFSTDGNGNLVDTLGNTPVQASTSGNTTTYSVLGFQGVRNVYTVTTEQISVCTGFAQQAVSEYCGTLTAIQSIALPNGQGSYSFTYDAYGEISSVTLPSGGTDYYNYTNYQDSYQNMNRWLSSMTRDGNTWTYTPAVLTQCSDYGTGCVEQVTVTPPSGNDTVYSFTLNNGAWNTQVAQWNGSSVSGGTLLKTNATTYDFSNSCNPSVCNGSDYINTTSTSTTLDGVGLTSSKTYTYDSALTGNLTSLQTWDFYSGSQPTNPTWETDYYYGYSGTHGQPSVTQTTAYSYATGSKTQVSQETRGYDAYSLVPVSGLPNHETLSSTPANLTNVNNGITNTTYAWDAAGMLRTNTTPNGTTSYTYDSTADAFLTQLTPPTPSSGVSLATVSAYDGSTGLLTSSTDANGQTTNYPSYDALLRSTEVDYPDGGKATFSYGPNSTSVYRYQTASTYADTETQLDSYGRKSRVAIQNGQGSNPWYQTDYCYDTTGRLQFQSTAYQSSGFSATKQCSGSGTAYAYDGIGRVTNVTNPDGAATYQYTGRAVLATDVNGVQKIMQGDAKGRVTGVCEISSNGSMPGSGSPQSCGMDRTGTGFVTSYSYYDPSLTTTVTQGAQTRVFQTDSIGRMIYTSEPEAGVTSYSYSYNSTGLAVVRTRPTANQTNPSVTTNTTTQYDSVGRVVSVSYTDGTPSMTYSYDQATAWGGSSLSLGSSKGQLTEVVRNTSPNWTGGFFVYDPMGRVTRMDECLPSGCGSGTYERTLNYTYDWLGNVVSSTDGGGVGTTYSYSPASEMLSVTSSANDSTHPPALVSNAQYGPFGPATYSLGNGTQTVRTYDSLGRNNAGWLCAGSQQTYCNGGQQLYGYTLSISGNRVTGRCDTVINQCSGFGYDEFNRLTVVSGVENVVYTYDRYGNRLTETITSGGSGTQPQLSVNTGSNQISGLQYDAAGNLMNDGTHQYTYDAEGNVTQVDSGSTAIYTYNNFNQRVRIDEGSTAVEFVFNPSGQRVSLFDGHSYAQLRGQYYFGASPLGYYTAATHFQHQDWLGTARVQTSYNGSIESAFPSLPFGEDLSGENGTTVYGGGSAQQDAYHFAGLDHDYESGTEHAQFRQLSSTQGRWFSPDPYSGSYNASDPQSLNRYSYVSNLPLSLTDPTGQFAFCGVSGIGTEGGLSVTGIGGVFLAGCIGDAIFHLLSDLTHHKPAFKGSLSEIPKGTGTPDWNDPWNESLGLPQGGQLPGGGITGALGLPTGGCEFGSCGNGFVEGRADPAPLITFSMAWNAFWGGVSYAARMLVAPPHTQGSPECTRKAQGAAATVNIESAGPAGLVVGGVVAGATWEGGPGAATAGFTAGAAGPYYLSRYYRYNKYELTMATCEVFHQ